MNRRAFLKSTLGVTALAGLGGYGVFSLLRRHKISLWGHSFFGNNTTFSAKLISETGCKVFNFGLSGATSESIALRNGAYSISYVSESGSLIPGEKNNLTPNVPGPLRIWGNAAADWVHLPCELAGKSGVLDWDGKRVTFMPESNGSVAYLNRPSTLNIYPMTTVATDNVAERFNYPDHPKSIYLLWLGRNNSTQPDEIMRDAKAIVARMDKGNNRFVILPEFPASYEPKGTKGADEIALINSLYKKAFPENYCEIDGVDMLQNFMNHHNPQSKQDLEDIKAGITPSSLRADELHPSITKNDGALFAGTEVNAEFVAKFLKLKGWV
ncbi:twin-arginine translocation signal domain-containing protein [Enterobacter chuandaensis]|uniref:twin-arginine translocation signal domain-containing protein n=1 Tax=Enterobacter chuandaensis TaxID=2497875 RepID=UPI0039C4E199